MLGRHVGMSAACLRLSRGARARNESPPNARARQAEGEEEREGQQRESREAAAKGRRRGSEGTPRTAQDRTHRAGHTQTGGGRSRGGERGGSRTGGEREDQKTGRGERAARTPERRQRSRVCSVRNEREIPGFCASGTDARVVPVPGASLLPLGGLTTDLCEGELPAQNVFMNGDSPHRCRSPNEANCPSKLEPPRVQGPERDRIRLNWNMLIILEGGPATREIRHGGPHVSRRCAMQSCSSSG